ncbi:MAG: type IV toxin-antitoxin system AbiEi family antitoxin domain-containing protein [Victivallales bacterium]|nr:type IV toxin-antitoxin system AbiEi family antitoxin domain-containing protein [Victivallales bacterium]
MTENGIIAPVTAYETIYDEAIGNYGLITVSAAKELGINAATLAKLAHRGRLERIAHGLYRIDKYVPSQGGLDAYACAVASLGGDSYLWGPSAIAIRNLCPTDPSVIYVATPARYRGKPRGGVIVKDRTPCGDIDNIEGIRVQGVCSAILSSQHMIMFDRLLDAVNAAKAQGIINAEQAHETTKGLYVND